MQIGAAGTATRAAQTQAQVYSRIAFAETLYQVGWMEQAPVFAAAANRDQSHFSTHEFTERASFASLPSIPVPGTHFVRLLH